MSLVVQLKVGQSEQEEGREGETGGGGVDLHTAVRPEGCERQGAAWRQHSLIKWLATRN